ncbi:MAG: hypothetical protein K2L55_10485 [Muribaculaceae bacterium]|nr:hypothetical protein [Muribaculaceae bacterium]
MKHKIEDANRYYRSFYPGVVIFYKLQRGYVAYGTGAVKLSSLLGIQLHTVYGLPSIEIPTHDFLDKTEVLNMCGMSYRAISYLDDNGCLTIPDVHRLIEEQENDY